jgi:DNA sulfur modification protein DndB
VNHHSELDKRRIPEFFREKFEDNSISLSQNAAVSVRKKYVMWSIIDNDNGQTYTVRKEKDKLNAYYRKISPAKTKAIAPRDYNSITSIITLYDVLEVVLREKGRRWNDFKKLRPKDSTISQYYNRAVQFWDTMIEHFPPLKEFKETSPGTSVAGRYRTTSGGHLLFRPVGLEIVASVIRQAMDRGLTEKEAIHRVSEISMDLADEPWVGLLWDKTNRRMVTDPTNQKVAKRLLFHMVGGNLPRMRTTKQDLHREYAGLLNKKESEVKLTQYYASLP